ncbi:M17 family metallopeptidase [Rhodonellum sp.]|uniref:leucyl aminopeptidase family protein n=1 Tax=Rhodonellum sp. TaxID=2231180 RepID=UPI0027276605|nr:leucyl aminopeptidase family protein [Rhodonellum sp.]MDO9554694.1 leucyl aminopeptidase family protein [Rhodonellum sp.]
MKISIDRLPQNHKGLILLPFEESESLRYPTDFQKLKISSVLFSGKKDTQFLLEDSASERTYLLIGLGKNPDYKTIQTAFRRLTAKQSRLFEKGALLAIQEEMKDSFLEAAVSGLYLGTYRLGHFKKTEEPKLDWENVSLRISSSFEDAEKIAERASKIANAQLQVFNLVDLPSNTVTPEYLSDWARNAGKTFGFEVKVLGRAEAKEQHLDAFLAVSQGSHREPQFIIAQYNPENPKKHIGLVGKGVTFDTGGLNIKTAGMVHMKCDMGGAAAVLGAMQAIADLKLPVKVTAIVPCVENSVDNQAFLPSDVIGSYAGKTIEIIDTDAEGRLILADGLSYLIKNHQPDSVIDLATLTGSTVGTFGYECAALFTNDIDLSQNLQKSGESIGERVWPLPLWDVYQPEIESEIADLKNYHGKPFAGAIVAAKFLEAFTENHGSWAHIDIAGTAFGDSEFAKTKHATGFGMHLLLNLLEKI